MTDLRPGSELAVLFHKAWGQARASPEYDEEIWKRLEAVLAGGDGARHDPREAVFRFPTATAAAGFVAYMSDGGGEQPFLETQDMLLEQGDITEADVVRQFDYSRDDVVVCS